MADEIVLTSLEVRANRFFEDFSEKEVAGLLKMCSMQAFGPGECIVRETETTDDLFVILSGTVRIGKILYAGDEKDICLLGPGEFFGEMAFLDGAPRSATVWSTERTVLLKLSRASFDRLVAKKPMIGYKIILKMAVALACRLRASNDLIEGMFSSPNKAIIEFKARLLKIQTMLMRR
jgi:CRP-like cAMP-binding protein